MRLRTSIAIILVGACCAGLAACTAGPRQGPDVTVTPPSVGKPPPPDSVQEALSRMAFSPYAALGQSNNDGLAPNESGNALSTACMSIAGYPDGGGNVPFGVNAGPASLGFSQPWGAWGYLGLADAEQYGFLVAAGSALSSLGIDVSKPLTPIDSLSKGEQDAVDKCATITGDFTNTVGNGPLAGIQTLANDIYNDVRQDASVKTATKAWSACMAKNGYDYPDPSTAYRDEMQNIFQLPAGNGGGAVKVIVGGNSVPTAQEKAQIAMAVTDADCTQSTDLSGIYFAVEASYEQQIVSANQQALASAVQQYRADYQKEVNKLPGLLKTTKAKPFQGIPRPVQVKVSTNP